MEEIFGVIVSTIFGWGSGFFQSTTFFVIKVFLAIYSAVLIVDVILLVYLGNVPRQLRTMRKGAANVKVSKKPDQRKWDDIIKRLDSNEMNQYKAAILEADRFVFVALDLQGYGGDHFSERLAQLPEGSFTSLNAVRDVHTLSNKIIQDQNIVITKEQAKNALGVYEKFLKNLDVL
jgi:hypothetical protein